MYIYKKIFLIQMYVCACVYVCACLHVHLCPNKQGLGAFQRGVRGGAVLGGADAALQEGLSCRWVGSVTHGVCVRWIFRGRGKAYLPGVFISPKAAA